MDIETEDDLENFAQAPEAEEAGVPDPLRFAPWHKPRKQFVRKEQWMRHIRGIILKLQDKGHFDNNEPFKYLTLPGPDLLDVKQVADLCGEQGRKLYYLGFCQTDEAESRRLRRNINEFSVSRSDEVVAGSKVILAPFQDIQHSKTEAFVTMSRAGTYDAINIDACDPIANKDQNSTGRLIDSIRCLAEYQMNNRRAPWVLFLTTPMQIDSISNESLDVLRQQVEINADSDKQFAEEIKYHCTEGEDLKSYMDRVCASNGRDFLTIVSLGITKWLIHLGEQARFRVKIMRSFNYSIFKSEPFEPNMASLCFLFEPISIPINDLTGLTRNPSENLADSSAVSDHIRALRKSYDMANVDNLLKQDDGLRFKMAEETKHMLRQAGYPVDDPVNGYDVWMSQFM